MFKLIPRNPFPHSINEIFISLFQKNNDRFFEKLLSFLNVSDGILVESGRQALYLILKTILKQGDEIIIPAFSCNVILGPIRKSCVQPVFADVNINSLNMNLENIEHLVTNKTRAVLVTHQFGYPADIDEIIEYCSEKHILVIEDAAPAFGAKYNGELVGKLGDVGFYSFQESKVISTINGGFIVGNSEPLDNIKKTFLHTESPQLSCFISTVKKWCISNPYIYFFLLNMYGLIHKKYSNADELNMELERYTLKYKNPSLFQRNLGCFQMENLSNILSTRKKAAQLYRKALADCSQVIDIPQSDLTKRSHVYSRFPILVKDKLLVYKKVKKAGVDLGFTFSYKLPQYFPNDNGKYPNTDYIIGHILNVPICRNMSSNKNIAIILENSIFA